MTWEPLADGDAQPRDLSSVLGRLHTTMGLARPDTLVVLEDNWMSLLGTDLASRCKLDSVRGSELVVAVDDPAVAEHLRWSSSDLCAAINALCGGMVVESLAVRVRRN